MSEIAHGNHYDVIIIGSGLGGLTAGALLAKSGKKAIVIERHDRVGGYAQSFKRHGFHFDSSIHFTGGGHPVESSRYGAILKTLELLGVEDRCTFPKLDPFIRLITPNFTFNAPLGNEAFIQALSARYPGNRQRISEFTALANKVNLELRHMPLKSSWWDTIVMPFRFPGIFKYHSFTLTQMLDRFFRDEEIKTVFGTFSLCFAMPPSSVSFLQWTQLYVSMICEEASYCSGTFQHLADVLSEAVRKYNGSILKKSEVLKIVTSGNKVDGVVLSSGERITAPAIISNADMISTYRNLLDPSFQSHPFVKHIGTLTPSMSAFIVYIGTDLPVTDPSITHETVILDSLNVDDCVTSPDVTLPRHLIISIPTLSDSSLAPTGNHAVILTAMIPYRENFSGKDKERLADMLIGKACVLLPGLDKHIIFREAATPSTLERYTKNYRGAIIGWEAKKDQVGQKRPPFSSPVLKGLYHVGHWTKPGGGVYGAMVSGRQVAQLLCGYRHAEDFVNALQE